MGTTSAWTANLRDQELGLPSQGIENGIVLEEIASLESFFPNYLPCSQCGRINMPPYGSFNAGPFLLGLMLQHFEVPYALMDRYLCLHPIPIEEGPELPANIGIATMLLDIAS